MSNETVDGMEAMMEKLASLEAQIADSNASIDLFFVLTMGVVCFLMQAGFGLLEVGSIRAKNASNIMLKNLMDASVSAIAYYLVGYSIAYGVNGESSFMGGTSYMVLQAGNLADVDYIYWFFNYVFAGTTATIVSGAVAERCQFRAYLVYSFALAGFIYPVCSHWIWDPNGFLNGKTYDFAGGGAVHMVGGWAAAVGALILGPRTGKFVTNEQGKKVPVTIPGHSTTLAVLGTLILWFGFFAFNGGSSYTIAGSAQFNATGRAVVVTTLGGAFGGMVTMFWGYLATKTWNIEWVINGLLAGMVATCSGANAIEPWAAIIVGVLGAIACQLQVLLFEHVLFIDDPLNASAVHLAAGAVGMVFVAFMANPDYAGEDFTGIFYGGKWDFLVQQCIGMGVYSGWTIGTGIVMFGGLRMIGWLRVDEESEMIGMDKSKHGGSSYPLDDEHTYTKGDSPTPSASGMPKETYTETILPMQTMPPPTSPMQVPMGGTNSGYYSDSGASA
jgi:Amt family ammonium transporter